MSEVLNLDAILNFASPAEQVVPLCLNGKLRRRYDEMAARIAERAAGREQSDLVARAVAVIDDRLGQKAGSDRNGDPGGGPVVVDPEQADLEVLGEQLRKHTVPFLVRAVSSQKWTQLMLDHPPRKDPATGRVVAADTDGINTSAFYPALVKLALVEPVMDDVQYEKVMAVVSDAQFSRLAKAAAEVNSQDEDLPFWPSGSEGPPV